MWNLDRINAALVRAVGDVLGTAVFATNLRVGPEGLDVRCQRYSRRWQIEASTNRSAATFSPRSPRKDYRVRLFYFVFAVLLYNIWRFHRRLLKADVDGEMDYAPVLTADCR